jgi:hypothetical protein
MFLNKDADGGRTYVTSAYQDTDGKPTTRVNIGGSDYQAAVDIQNRYQKTVQAHNNASIAATSYTSSEWIDTQGFNEIAITLLNDATTSSNCEILWSHNASTRHGTEIGVSSGTGRDRTASVTTKARYVKLNVYNADTTTHTFSSWIYLKV